MLQPEQSEQKEALCQVKNSGKPGELLFVIFLFAITAAFLYEAMKLPGLQKGLANAPGAIPQLITVTVLVLICLVAAPLLRQGRKQAAAGAIGFLFSKEVVVLLILVLGYAFILELLHFELTTLIFLWTGMYFLERKNPFKKLIISVGTVGVIILIFFYAFRVVLP